MTYVNDTPEGRLYARILHECPACKSQIGFYAGPRGGISQNIFCKNEECRMSYNVTPRVRWAEILGVANLDRYRFVTRNYNEETWTPP